MAIQISKREATDYLLVYLLAAISGMPFYDGDIPLVGVFGFVFLVFFLRREGFHRIFFFYLFAFIALLLLHSLRFDYLPLNTYVGFIIKVAIGYLVVAILKRDFITKYINIIYFFAIVSFFFAIPLLISENFDNIFNAIGVKAPFEPGERKSLIIFHLNLDRQIGIYRNCGPFWEPAAFGGYLLLALMFNLAKTNSLKNKKSLVLIVTLISTFSTTVFMLLAILLFFYFIVNQTFLAKLIIIPVVLIGFGYAFYSLEFLSAKLEGELEEGDRQRIINMTGSGHTRLSSAIADFRDIKKYPIIGRGLFPLNFYDIREVATRHNGLTMFIAQFGIVGSVIYFYAIFLTFYRLLNHSNLHNFLSIIFLVLVWGMGIAENYFDKPFFWGLFFLHIVLRHYEEDNNYSVDELANEKRYA